MRSKWKDRVKRIKRDRLRGRERHTAESDMIERHRGGESEGKKQMWRKLTQISAIRQKSDRLSSDVRLEHGLTSPAKGHLPPSGTCYLVLMTALTLKSHSNS